MKKLLVLVSVFALMLTVAQAQETAKADEDPGCIGIGYQGMLMGNAILNGASIRYQSQDSPLGLEANFGQWAGDIEMGGDEFDIDIYALQVKAMYTLIKRKGVGNFQFTVYILQKPQS